MSRTRYLDARGHVAASGTKRPGCRDVPRPIPEAAGLADAYTERILERLRRETPTVPSSTRIGGSPAIRPCLIHPRTTMREGDGHVDAVLRFGDELAGA